MFRVQLVILAGYIDFKASFVFYGHKINVCVGIAGNFADPLGIVDQFVKLTLGHYLGNGLFLLLDVFDLRLQVMGKEVLTNIRPKHRSEMFGLLSILPVPQTAQFSVLLNAFTDVFEFSTADTVLIHQIALLRVHTSTIHMKS